MPTHSVINKGITVALDSPEIESFFHFQALEHFQKVIINSASVTDEEYDDLVFFPVYLIDDAVIRYSRTPEIRLS
jgi:hypothetical protein